MTASKIEWCDRSDWNPIRGCTRESEGCRHCYAETIAARFSDPGQPFHGFAERTASGPRWTGKIELVEKRLTLPLCWRKPARIFVNSMFDLFHESVPDEWIDKIFAVMALCPQHTFIVLTKRAKRMWEWASRERRVGWPLPNVWWGVSVEDQRRADERIPYLLATRAAVRWISNEPSLGPANFAQYLGWKCCITNARANDIDSCGDCDPCIGALGRQFIDWVVVGGESGPGARPFNLEWARSIIAQCRAANVACFIKQVGSQPYSAADDWPGYRQKRNGTDMAEWPEDLRIRAFPGTRTCQGTQK